jgi:hypothetical protein
MMKNLLKQADVIPPCICRLCARMRGGKAKTMDAIAALSGLDLKRAKHISRQPTWGNITLAEATAFSAACDVNLLRPRKKLFYLKRAFATGGIAALSGGLGEAYVIRQLEIRRRYDERERRIEGSGNRAVPKPGKGR